MATLETQLIDEDGADVNALLVAADVAGDTVVAASGQMIVIENLDAAPHTLTIAAPVASVETKYGSCPVTDLAIVAAAGETISFTVPTGYQSNGNIAWTYDAVTTVSIGVFTLG